MNTEASMVIRKHFKGENNFLTPNIINREWAIKDKVAYELSTGEGFGGGKIWGVTVVEVEEGGATKQLYDLGGCCHSEEEAHDKIANIIEEVQK
jgi:hypothetical protein